MAQLDRIFFMLGFTLCSLPCAGKSTDKTEDCGRGGLIMTLKIHSTGTEQHSTLYVVHWLGHFKALIDSLHQQG